MALHCMTVAVTRCYCAEGWEQIHLPMITHQFIIIAVISWPSSITYTLIITNQLISSFQGRNNRKWFSYCHVHTELFLKNDTAVLIMTWFTATAIIKKKVREEKVVGSVFCIKLFLPLFLSRRDICCQRLLWCSGQNGRTGQWKPRIQRFG